MSLKLFKRSLKNPIVLIFSFTTASTLPTTLLPFLIIIFPTTSPFFKGNSIFPFSNSISYFKLASDFLPNIVISFLG